MITQERAIASKRGEIFEHTTAKNSDGTPLRCRVNGKCRVTKSGFTLPVKYGLRHCFYITNENSNSWTKTN